METTRVQGIARGLFAGWLFAAGAAAVAAAPPDQLLVQRIQAATASADVPTLAELYRQPPDAAAKALAAMALERIHGNLDASSADAQLCERALFDRRPELAFFCAIFDNGNLRLREGPAVADAAETGIARRFAGRIPEPRLAGLRAYAQAHANAAAMTAAMPDADFTLPMEVAAGSDLGTLEVGANGARALLIVDTGAGGILLDAATAKRMGVRMLGRARRTNGMLSRSVNLEAGMLDELSIGPLTLHHVPVAVGSGRVRLIGLDVLKALGTFRIARHAVTVYRTAKQRPACEQPLLLASDQWGNSIRATVALAIDGRLRTVLIDSGSSFYLSGDEAAAKEQSIIYAHRIGLRDVGPGTHEARVSQATARVVIAGQPIDMTFGVFKDAALPWHYVLGSGALGDMDFYFDFPGRHSCQLLHANLH